MPQPLTINDVPAGEQVVHGSQKITFGAAGQLIAEEITFNKPVRSIDFPNSSIAIAGSDNHSAYSTQKGIGTAVIQMKGQLTVLGIGDTFNFNHPGDVQIPCFVTDVGAAYTQGGIRKIPIKFAERLTLSPISKLSFYDGDFSTAQACGQIRVSEPIMGQPTAYLLKQQFRQRADQFAHRPALEAGPSIVGRASFLVDETELQDTGVGGIVTWDRVWATLPDFWSTLGTVTKTIKYLRTLWNGENMVAASVVTRTKSVRCEIQHDYSFGAAVLPPIPDVSIYVQGTVTTIMFIDGWPVPTSGNPNSSNEAYSFISGDIQLYMGQIQHRTRIFGPLN